MKRLKPMLINSNYKFFPLTKRCSEIYSECDHAIIGISPFNSYFSIYRIGGIISAVQEKFLNFDIYIPDEPSLYTLLALGYEPDDAARKVRRQTNYLRNKITRVLEGLGFSKESSSQKIIGHRHLQNKTVYEIIGKSIKKLYDSDPIFQSHVWDTTLSVLNARAAQSPNRHKSSKRNVRLGVKYVLSEIPIMISANIIFDKRYSAFCYHKCPIFLQYLYETQRSNLVSNNQAYLKVAMHRKEIDIPTNLSEINGSVPLCR